MATPTISPRAASELRDRLRDLPGRYLRISIDHRCHCGSAQFSLNLDDKVSKDDEEFVVDGLPFVADTKTRGELAALEIDYTQDWMRQGFTVTNANHDCGGHH